jgi:hypothetical protein
VKYFKGSIVILLFLSLSGLVFGQFTLEDARQAMAGIRAAVLKVKKTCRGGDSRKVDQLLTLMRGCKLKGSNNETDRLENRETCIFQIIETCERIESIECKAPFLRNAQQVLAQNLLNHWRWVASASDRLAFETRLDAVL